MKVYAIITLKEGDLDAFDQSGGNMQSPHSVQSMVENGNDCARHVEKLQSARRRYNIK